MTADDHEPAWVRFDLDTPADVIDRFIEASVLEGVEEMRGKLIDEVPGITEAQLAVALARVEAWTRESARQAFASAFKRLMH